jgi:GWxTD domain-containing protein
MHTLKLSCPILKALFLFSWIALFVGSCSNHYIDEIDRGSGFNYQPGFPELRVAVTGHINKNSTPAIIISGDIVYASLVYTKNQNAYEATVSIEIALQKMSDDKEDNVVKRVDFKKTIHKTNERIINSQDVYRFERTFEVAPGNYAVKTVVTDKASGKQAVRTLQTSIPDPADSISHLTEIRIMAKDSSNLIPASSFHQATTYDIPSSFDSLKFLFQVTNNKAEEPLELQSRLLKFKSDTTIARPMHYMNYTSSSLPYKGIDYDKFEVIQRSTRTLSQPGSVDIEFIFTDLSQGNYRLEVTSNKGEENELYKARDFSIKSPNYPSLKTPRELAAPLYYLMSEDKYEQLMAIKDPKKLKNAIDRFWLSNIQNSRVAKNVISLYYQRVEEANKQFSNFKEGWKTDLGMVYILFGPPWYSDSFSDQMVWSYSYNQSDPEKNFLFVQPKLKSKFYPFYNYLLQRNAYYYNIQYQQQERWRIGSILTTNL